MKTKLFLPIALSGLIFLQGCPKPKPGETSVKLEVLQPEAQAGDLLPIEIPGGKKLKKESFKVTIGDQPAYVASYENNRLMVIVPNLSEGEAAVNVTAGGKVNLTTRVTLQPAPAKRIFLKMEKGNKFEMISSSASNDPFTQVYRSGEGEYLSYDVLDGNGNLLATSLVPHPLGGFEIPGEKEGTLEKVKTPSAQFEIIIPNLPGASSVIFYQVNPKTPLTDKEGMENREKIGEISIR